MTKILDLILDGATKATIMEKLRSGSSKLSLFTPIPALKNKSLYDYLVKYKKIRNWSLKDFIECGVVDVSEENDDDQTLLHIFLDDQNIDNIKMLLSNGVILNESDYQLATESAKEFLDYKPGSNASSIYEYCARRKRDSGYLIALFNDQADTTSGESSSAASMSEDSFSESEEEAYEALQNKELKKYSKNSKNATSLRLVAARGVHFAQKFFSAAAVEKCIDEVDQPHTTFSQSTLFDADGYTSDEDFDESDETIKKRHKKVMKFIQRLKDSDDKPETTIKSSQAPATRNKQDFENHYYRYMQVYINSYNRLFNLGSVIIDFGFDSKRNPEVSASWNFSKAAMYASGFRFDWNIRSLRKDPHYRRSTGKAKHPNMGYLDIYSFDISYVRDNGFDRQLMCDQDFIKLSAFFRHEAEIIFHSLIPKKYNIRRCIISLPSFDKPYDKDQLSRYGISSKTAYNNLKATIQALPANKKSDNYKSTLNSITEKAAAQQAGIIEKTTHCRLFREDKPKVVVYDHGDKLKSTPFKL